MIAYLLRRVTGIFARPGDSGRRLESRVLQFISPVPPRLPPSHSLSLVSAELTKVCNNSLKWRPRSRLILSVSAYIDMPSVPRLLTEIAYFRLLLFAKFAIRLAQRINVFARARDPFSPLLSRRYLRFLIKEPEEGGVAVDAS